jgi:hypothetical protein
MEPVIFSAREGHTHKLEWLINVLAVVDIPKYQMLLMEAAAAGQLEVVKFLVDAQFGAQRLNYESKLRKYSPKVLMMGAIAACGNPSIFRDGGETDSHLEIVQYLVRKADSMNVNLSAFYYTGKDFNASTGNEQGDVNDSKPSYCINDGINDGGSDGLLATHPQQDNDNPASEQPFDEDESFLNFRESTDRYRHFSVLSRSMEMLLYQPGSDKCWEVVRWLASYRNIDVQATTGEDYTSAVDAIYMTLAACDDYYFQRYGSQVADCVCVLNFFVTELGLNIFDITESFFETTLWSLRDSTIDPSSAGPFFLGLLSFFQIFRRSQPNFLRNSALVLALALALALVLVLVLVLAFLYLLHLISWQKSSGLAGWWLLR